MSRAAATRLGFLVLAVCAWSAEAQTFRFDKLPVPKSFELTTHYMFYVYAEDAPTSMGVAASLEFSELSFAAPVDSHPVQPLGSYTSIEVSVLPYDKFGDLLNSTKFCVPGKFVYNKANLSGCHLKLNTLNGLTPQEHGASTVTVPYDGAALPATRALPIRKSGRYIVVLSNCGKLRNATVSGKVRVKSAHGYLPAHELKTLSVYGWLAVMYTFVFAIWFVLLLCHWKTLFYVQKGIAVIGCVCIMEAVAARREYSDWNDTGDRRDDLGIISAGLHMARYFVAWRVLLMSTTSTTLSVEDINIKQAALFIFMAVLFMVQSAFVKFVFANRFGHVLDTQYVLLALLPGAVINTLMAAWATRALSGLIKRLEEQKQDGLLSTVRQVRVVLLMGLAMAAIVGLLQAVFIEDAPSWEHQWMLDLGAPHLVFALVLVAMMFVWWPSEDSWWSGYIVQADNEETTNLYANKGHDKATAVFPEPIGMAEDEEICLEKS